MKTPPNFKCKRCGSCCLVSPFLSDKDISRIKRAGFEEDFFVEKLNNKKFMKTKNNKCIFLKKGETTKCKIYKARPDTCKRYPSEIRADGDCTPRVLSFDEIS